MQLLKVVIAVFNSFFAVSILSRFDTSVCELQLQENRINIVSMWYLIIIGYNLYICMTKSDIATQFWLDMYDNNYTFFDS